MGINCLVLGGGGREYAIAWRLARSDFASNIDVVPGNAGLALFARVPDFSPRDIARLEQHVAAARIDLAIVGPDDLLADGLADTLRRSAIAGAVAGRVAARSVRRSTCALEHTRDGRVAEARVRTSSGI